MINGSTNVLSVILVTTVSVKVLFVMISVTLPGPVGGGGNSIGGSGLLIVTVVTEFVTLSLVAFGEELVGVVLVGVGVCLRKWGGIIAWNSSLVIGLENTCVSSSSDECDDVFLWLVCEAVFSVEGGF